MFRQTQLDSEDGKPGPSERRFFAETGWQPHTVRGIVSGTLKKKLGLTVVSAKEERGRVYRIAAQAAE